MDFKELSKRLTNEEDNDEYIGNMWGWKFSLFGLFLIVFMSALTWYGHKTGKVDITTGEPMKKSQPASEATVIDSTKIK